jgi:hypothetical protein
LCAADELWQGGAKGPERGAGAAWGGVAQGIGLPVLLDLAISVSLEHSFEVGAEAVMAVLSDAQ